jgi:hypothetical protein
MIKHFMKEMIDKRTEPTGRQVRRRKQLLETTRYCKLKDEALARICGGFASEVAMDLS